MRMHATESLFPWGALEDHPCLMTIRDFLDTVPDKPLLDGLQAARAKGRDDYPIPRLWRIFLLTILLRHSSLNPCLAGLHRNPALGSLIEISDAKQIPRDWNLSRFLDVLGQEPHLTALRDIFNALASRLGRAVPDLGRHTAGDATALSARPQKEDEAVAAETAQGLPQRKKEYRDDDGKVVKDYEWFGYKPHLLVDGKHEVALAYNVSDTKVGDNDGNVTGARRLHALVGTVLVAQLVFATLLARAPRWEGRYGQTRLGPCASAAAEGRPGPDPPNA